MAFWEYQNFPSEIDLQDAYARQFEWEYQNSTFEWTMELPKNVYEMRKVRMRIYDYGAYVADTLTQNLFDGFGETIVAEQQKNGYSTIETVEFVSRFVQSLEYVHDDISTGYNNYPRYPIETLVDEVGDCEDSSLLLAALLDVIGLEVGLLEFDNHLGVGVALDAADGNVEFHGTDYTYIETTDTGWDPGELPPGLDGASVSLHEVDDSPVLHTHWQAEPQGNEINCSGALLNHGEGVANDVGFYLIVKDQSGEPVGGVQKEWDSIHPGQEVQWNEPGPLSPGRSVDAQWKLSIDGIVHDESELSDQRI